MSTRAAPSPFEHPVGWRVVLGLSEPKASGWQRVRAAQLEGLLRALPLIAIVQILNAVSLSWLLWRGDLPLGGGLWLAAMTGLLLSAALRRRVAMPLLPTTILPGAMRRAAIHAFILGALWSVPPLFFAAGASEPQRAAIYLIACAMMTSGTLTASTIPQVALLNILGNAIGLTAMMAAHGDPVLALLPPIYAVALALCACFNSRDFIQRKCAEIALEDKNEVVSLLLREFEENGADWLWQVDSAKQLVGVSQRLARAAGATPAALEGAPLLQLFAGTRWNEGALPPEHIDLLERLNRRESFKDVVVPITVDGEVRWWCLSATPRIDENGRFTGFRGVGSDQTEQRRSVARIDQMARLDPLTGLHNRREIIKVLRGALAHALRERGRCALMLIDLDRFKAVNDTLGHPVGDRLLKLVSDRIGALLTTKDMGGRLGGDEFAVVVTDARDVARIDWLGAAIVQALSEPFAIDEHVIQIGASVGTALGPRDGRSVETLLRHADVALYQAKKEGRGMHRRYEPRLMAGVDRRRTIETAMRDALEKGGLQLGYRRIVNAAALPVQFEARPIWTDPRLDTVSADEVSAIAEDTKLSAAIGEWVTRTACAEAARWPGTPRLAIDVARSQLLDRRFAAMLFSALSHAGLPPERLEINVPEALLVDRYPEVAAGIERIRTLGVRVALDGFGGGLSPLSVLRPDHFDAIKLGAARVQAAQGGDTAAAAMIRAAGTLSDALGMELVARGIDDIELAAFAEGLGCPLREGAVDGPPLDSAAVEALLASGARAAA